MSRMLLTSDLHLGHTNIHKYREGFASAEEHHEIIWDKLATFVTKRDTIIFLGDIAFTQEWLSRIANLKVRKKVLLLGNHDTERDGIKIQHIAEAYDEVHGLLSYRNHWLSHCPIHPQELRGRRGNVHGHLHGNMVWQNHSWSGDAGMETIDNRYINVCVEHTDYQPITWQEATQ